MKLVDRLAFDEGLDRLAVAFGKELDADRAAVYWEALEAFPVDIILAGMKRATLEERYFPPPKVIRDWAQVTQAAATSALSAEAAAVGEGEYACAACQDTGWERQRRFRALDAQAEHPGKGWYAIVSSQVQAIIPDYVRRGQQANDDATWYEKDWVCRCGCWSTNPVRKARAQHR